MTHRDDPSRILATEALARVEGEGAMRVVVEDGAVGEVELRIYEPPRFFEAFLRGRRHTEPPDITARICGICPVAYQMSACQAIEDACGVTVGDGLGDLRRLLYCGEWIESHALHIYFLHVPDFLGYPGAAELARDHRDLVEAGLAIKKAGNEVLRVLGGRSVHPVNVRVGGFYRLPSRGEIDALRDPLRRALDLAAETVELVAGFDFPDFERDYEFVALRGPGRYPIEAGRIVSNRGLDIASGEFEDHVAEDHVAHSTALRGRLVERGGYLVGPLARFALNADLLPAEVREVAERAGLSGPCRNPFRSIVVRAVELLFACHEALALLDRYDPPARPAVDVPPREGRGTGCTEAPRGILYHRYDLAADGTIRHARIVPPTAQNQTSIEDDLRAFVQAHLEEPDEMLTHHCEQAIRNYDPCISCATHFLDLRMERR